MDIGVQVFRTILCQRLFRIINKHGVKYQFGSTPDIGFQDSKFTTKTLLHMIHNHNISTYVAFIDLVEAFDTLKHDLLMDIIKQYGDPPKIRPSDPRMYTYLKVAIKIGKIEHSLIKQWECYNITTWSWYSSPYYLWTLPKHWKKDVQMSIYGC